MYIKLVGTGKYIGTATGFGGSGCGVVSDPANASHFQIISCAEDIPWSNTYSWDNYQSGVYRDDATYTEKEVANWRTNGAGRGSDNNSVGFCWSKDEESFYYLGFWGSEAPHVLLWQYTDTNQWNVYGASYEESLQDDLLELIDVYTGNTDVEFIPGTDPGYYGEAEVAAYEAALEAALIASVNSNLSDEDYKKAIDDLMNARATVENSLVPITEGYYYFVNGFADFLNNFGVEKAAYIDASVPNLKYKTFDPEAIDFVFYVTPTTTKDEFLVQSYANNYYVAKGTQWYASNPAATIDPEEAQNITLRYTGLWFWGSHTYHSTSYTPYASNQPTASDGAGNLTSWAVWNDPATTDYHSNLWYMRRISDEQMTDFEAKKAQADLDAQLKELANNASDLYDKLFVWAPDYENPLITNVSGGADEEPGDGNQLTFSTIRKQGVAFADKYEYLIDDNDTTYMQGSGYISVKLNEPKQVITFVYNIRGASGKGSNPNWQVWGSQERPNLVRFYGCNTLAGDTVYGEPLATNVSMGSLPLPATYTFDFGRPVNRVAYYVDTNANGGTYFTLSEFQMYEANADKKASQYYTVDGLGEKADAMKAMIEAKRAIADAGSTTAADIAEMQAAIAAVEALYADTTKLVELVDRANFLTQNTEVGEGIGQVAEAEAIATLSAAVTAAKELGLKPNATKAELDAAIDNLKEAIDNFVALINSFKAGKWYFILNGDLTEGSELNGQALYTSGYSNTSATKVGKVVEGNPDYTFDPYSMWRFVEAENGTYYVQNLGTGFYLPGGSTKGNNVGQSYDPVAYTVEFSGNGTYAFTPQATNSHKYVLGANGGNVVYTEAGVADSTTWQLVEIDTEETEAIIVKDFKLNAMDIFAVPYNVSDIAILNEENDCHIYGIKSMTYDEDTDETTVVFYEKNELAANEAAFFVFGNAVEGVDYEEFELMIPFPTEVVNKLDPSVSNGIYGMLYSERIDAGIAYGSGKGLIVAGDGGTSISAHTGAIDPKYYKGEIEDVEAAFSLTVKGLVWSDDVTGVKGGITVEDIVNAFRKGAYTIDGQKVTAPQKGQIYIIDGEKVKY
ncbi:MAG: hypothetical protein J1F13_03750 [Prevotellaceae bacterium]|nr:hypothetical protein [Prevotellaceae bacterium]